MFFALAPPSLALLALSLLGLAKPVALAELGQGTTPNAVNKRQGIDLWSLVDADDAELMERNCRDNPCECIPPRYLYRFQAEPHVWGCTYCAGACPEGDFAKGGRESFPEPLPEAEEGFAPGECGVHFTIYTINDGTTLDHIDFKVQDANTKELATKTYSAADLLAGPVLLYPSLGPNDLTWTQKGSFLTYGHDQTSFDGTQRISGVGACSLGDPEDGIRQTDCGFHCL